MVKTKITVKNCLLLTLIFLGGVSVLALSEQVHLALCSGVVRVVPDDYQKISWAIGNASDGDTILIRPGAYFEVRIIVDKVVTIVGENAETTIIDGQNVADNIFNIIADQAIVENLTVKSTDPDPTRYCSAIQIYNAKNVTVKNVIVTNAVIGVDIRSSNESKLTDCRINNTILCGIRLQNSNNNSITDNTLDQNHIGIYISDMKSKYNRIHHNNFIDNTQHVSLPSAINYFDDGYPSGGNYWSDYNGTDLKSGNSQNETRSDGILDQGYPDPNYPLDRYPLLNPIKKLHIFVGGHTFTIETSSNSTIIAYGFNSSKKTLDLFVNSSVGAFTTFRVEIPQELLSCDMLNDWEIAIYYSNNLWQTLLDYLPESDKENTYLFFTYNNTTFNARIEIKGARVIPEFTFITTCILSIFSIILISPIGKLKEKDTTYCA